MSTYKFSNAERYAVFTVHAERCWLCGEPVGLLEMEVDHVVPEALAGTPELAEALELLGLPGDFDLNQFGNWMPAHRRCNRFKSDAVFQPSPLIQMVLQKAIGKAARAQELHDAYVTNRRISMAINALLAAHEIGGIDERHRRKMAPLVEAIARDHEGAREVERRGEPLFLAGWLEVVAETDRMLTLRGPGGLVGVRPKAERLDPSWDCPNCGVTGWNGARCITCGMLDDGD